MTRTRSGLRHLPRLMEDAIDAFEADRNHRHAQPRRHHPDAGTKRTDFAMIGTLAFWKDQHREAVADELARVAQRLPRARLALWQRERVEKGGREVVLEASSHPLSTRVPLRKEMRLEEFLRHRRRDAAAPPAGQRCENHRHVHVALMIGREDHRAPPRCADAAIPRR